MASTVASFFVALNVFLLTIVAFYNFYWKRRKLPPGPTPLPLIGNMHVLYADPSAKRHYYRWVKQYGPVFTFWMGEQPVVMFTDYAQIVETFIKDGDAYAGRTPMISVDPRTQDGPAYGVLFSEGGFWRDHRRFTLQVFRDFGVGKTIMQDKILTEISARFMQIDKEIAECARGDRKNIDLTSINDIAVGSIINGIIFGYRFDETNESEFFELKQIVHEMSEWMTSPRIQALTLCPGLFTRLPYFRDATLQMREGFSRTEGFVMEHIKRANVVDSDSAPTDYVTAYLRERKRRQLIDGIVDDEDDEKQDFSIRQLLYMCLDLWIAGQETTSTTLAWGIAYILHHPEVQERMQRELDTVIADTNRLIIMTEKPLLPYTNAVINEIQRLANILPINLLHRTMRDVTVAGHFLPKGTCIIPQISAVLTNDEYFPEASRFNPLRFLGADGQLIKCDAFIPFSVGKRQCLGESLARMELFLIIANLFNRYTVLPFGEPPPLKRYMGISATLLPYRCQLSLRRVSTTS